MGIESGARLLPLEDGELLAKSKRLPARVCGVARRRRAGKRLLHRPRSPSSDLSRRHRQAKCCQCSRLTFYRDDILMTHRSVRSTRAYEDQPLAALNRTEPLALWPWRSSVWQRLSGGRNQARVAPSEPVSRLFLPTVQMFLGRVAHVTFAEPLRFGWPQLT